VTHTQVFLDPDLHARSPETGQTNGR
jgi:hypothetical protein